MKGIRFSLERLLIGLWMLQALALPGFAVAEIGCGIDGYRVIAHRWDPVLKTGWELRENCTHPEWPTRSIQVRAGMIVPTEGHISPALVGLPVFQPMLVQAGDVVRLWEHDDKVRIEVYGIAEQSARLGSHITVRVVQQHGEQGSSVERIAGIVRAADDLEIER